jgi:ABC-2 type transport system ATP-binding protein
MWFVYQLFFDVADAHRALHYKLKGIRIDRLALKSALNGRSLDKPMDENSGISLILDNFSKKYGLNKHYSVKGVSLTVKGGEVFGFLGPNGAGKSTCIKSIVGIQPITEGSISVCGYDIKTQAVFAKALIGFVPDHYALYENLTGREYLNYIADIYEVSKEDRDERLAKYITRFELTDSIDNKIKTYSHGMKQKITIISALVHNPKVWILDEPLTGLDPTSIFQVKECMREHASKGNIVFFSSHLIDIVEKLCDRIAIIKHGEIQVQTSLKELEDKGQSLEKFYLDIIGDSVTKTDK